MGKVISVSNYIALNDKWHEELTLLREMMLSCNLTECIKWGAPAYVHNGENIIGLVAFKSYVGIWFHQGVFLNDSNEKLYNANQSKTKGLRQWRFKNTADIEEHANLIVQYTLEAIQNQEKGLKIKSEQKKTLIIPRELQDAFKANIALEKAFNRLSLSKQIEYANYIIEAKQNSTKQSRLKKIVPMIINLEGLHDKYKRKIT